MRRISLHARFGALFLLLAFITGQALAVTHGCDACPQQHDAGCVAYLSAGDSSAPDVKASWPLMVFLADAGGSSLVRNLSLAKAAPGLRANLFRDARHVSIVQLNLRQ